MSRAFEAHIPHRAPFSAQQRRLLCATDLSAHSAQAVRAAAVLANRLAAQLTVLHVHPTGRASSPPPRMSERLRDQLCSAPSLLLDSVPVLAVRVGDPAKVIAQVARETGAELIVMGAQRKRSLAPLVGTTAERVIALTRCPVLIVRSQGTLRHDKVVVSADLTPSFKDVLRFADRWSFLDSPRVSVVHAFQSPYQGPLYTEGDDLAAARRHITRWKRVAREYLLKKLNAAGVRCGRVELRVEESLPLRLVRREVRRAVSPLLILGTSEHTVLSRAVRGSLASDALLTLECDVLICPSNTPQSMLH